MWPRPWTVGVCALPLFLSSLTLAEPKSDQQEIGPAGKWIGYAISKKGLHSAVMIAKGSRYCVVVDGAEGPRVDGLLDLGGAQSIQGSPVAGNSSPQALPVIFSDDGAHSAYLGRVSDEYLIIEDGKEIYRGKKSGMLTMPLTFTANGKHLYLVESDTSIGYRFIM